MKKISFLSCFLLALTFIANAQTLDVVVGNGNSTSKEIELSQSNGLILKQNTRTSGFNSLRIGQYGSSTQFMRFVPYSTLDGTWDWNHELYYDFDNTIWGVDGGLEVDKLLRVQTPEGDNKVASILVRGTGQNHSGTTNNTWLSGSLISGTADDASFGRYNVGIESWFGIGFRSSQNGKEGIIFNTRSASAYFEGNIGVGTSSPESKAHIIANNTTGSNKHSFIIQDNPNNGLDGGVLISSYQPRLILNDRSATSDWYDFRVDNEKLIIGQGEGADQFSRVRDDQLVLHNGQVGIGTRTPESKLHVDGDITFKRGSQIKIGSFNGGGNASQTHTIIKNGWRHGQDYTSIHAAGITPNTESSIVIQGSGNVGIGTTETYGYKLAVNGTIGAKEVIIETSSPWPDFVFEKDYDLRTLEEVSVHIEEKGHLPEIPSADVVGVKGINSAEMDAKLLQKIEELTLYLIEQNKKNKDQQARIEELEKKLLELENSQ